MKLSVLTILLSAFAAAAGQVENFEGASVPAAWSASRPGSLALTSDRAVEGKQALAWDWRAGEALTIRHGESGSLLKIDSFYVPGIQMAVHQKGGDEREFQVEFLAGGKKVAGFPLVMDGGGWMRARVHYPVIRTGAFNPAYDTIRIHAPRLGAGRLLLDEISYNAPLHVNHGFYPFPGRAGAWIGLPEWEDFTLEDLRSNTLGPVHRSGGVGSNRQGPTYIGRAGKERRLAAPLPAEAVSPAELAAADKFLKTAWREFVRARVRLPGKASGKTPAQQIQEFGLTRTPDGVRGDHARVPEMRRLIHEIAEAYPKAPEAKRDELEAAYLLLWDFLWEYGYRPHQLSEPAMALTAKNMRGVLERTNRWEDAFTYFDYVTGVLDYMDLDMEPRALGYVNIDHFGYQTPVRWKAIAFFDDPVLRVQLLRGYAGLLEKELLQDNRNGLKEDGALFHHGYHNSLYASYQLNNAVLCVLRLQDTPWELSEAAYERIKQAFVKMNFYFHNGMTSPTLTTRRPWFAGNCTMGNPDADEKDRSGGFGGRTPMNNVVRLKSPDKKHETDPELAAIYLMLNPGLAGEPLFVRNRIAPAAPPQGARTLGYSGLLAYRRNHWLAVAKGISAYHAGNEHYDARYGDCRFGGWFGTGDLFIMSGADPKRQFGSGYVFDAWDYNRTDGVTALELPPARLELPPLTTTRTAGRFTGGLSFFGMDGIFTVNFDGLPYLPDARDFKVRKSYFFIDGRILCLGSDIGGGNRNYPVITTLTQKYLYSPEYDAPVMAQAAQVKRFEYAFPTLATPTVVNGEGITGRMPDRKLDSARINWLIDTHRTGFLVPPGQSLWIARKTQRSFYADLVAASGGQKFFCGNAGVESGKHLEADYLTAWLDHGKAPERAGYEYLVIPDATPEKMRDLAGRPAPYRVLRQDGKGHIVRFGNKDCYVLFGAQRLTAATGPLLGTDRAVLVMAEMAADGETLRLSVANPDLDTDAYGTSRVMPVTLALDGDWVIAGRSSDAVHMKSRMPKESSIVVDCRYGRSYDIVLKSLNKQK